MQYHRFVWLCVTCVLALLLANCRHVKSNHARPLLRASNADRSLRPGDILLLYEETPKNVVQGVIRYGQELIKLSFSPFRPKLKRGRVGATHAAMYVGGGILAEAEGTTPENALVRMQTMDVHAGFRFIAYRAKDGDLAARASSIAKRWATGRMAYLVPAHVLFARADYNKEARRNALIYAQGAHRKGGPKEVKALFCSQFVWAVYQAAALVPQLAKRPHMTADELTLPTSLALNARNVSPMDITAHFLSTRTHPQGFQQTHDFVVDIKAKVERKGVGDWLKRQSLKALQATGKGIETGAKAAGRGIVTGAKAAGRGIVTGAKAAGKAIQKLWNGKKKTPVSRPKPRR